MKISLKANELKEQLCINLSVLIEYQVKSGKTHEEINEAVRDCLKYVEEKAASMAGGNTRQELNIVNIFALGILAAVLQYQDNMIANQAQAMGISREVLLNEMIADTESEIHKMVKDEKMQTGQKAG